MNKLFSKQGSWRWLTATVAMLVVIGAVVATLTNNGTSASAASAARTVTVWVQATDSCTEAIPGARFIVNGPGIVNGITAQAPGTGLVGLNTYMHTCPVDQGTCTQTTTGCVSITLNVPATGTALYHISPLAISGRQYLEGIVFMPQTSFGPNYAYVWCEGGSDCIRGPETAYVVVSSNGSTATWVRNFEPDGTFDRWPSQRSAFAGTTNDPVMFHLFGASAPNDFTITCVNGGRGLKDHLTGYRWPHCNSGH